jgi:hypothetical protein
MLRGLAREIGKMLAALWDFLTTPLSNPSILEYVKVLAWPITAIVLLLLIRPQLRELLPSSKIKVSIFGVSIETTLPELQRAMNECLGGQLGQDQTEYLAGLYGILERAYPTGVRQPESQIVRPLRNAGLVKTIPSHASLGDSTAIRITDLGVFLMRHKLNNRNGA